jgi:hypothetical protein
MADRSKRETANAEFKKAQRAADGKSVMSDYEAEAAAVRARTEKLKALRLARDAAAPVPAVAPKRKAGRKEKAPAKKLSDWLDDRAKGGRTS